MRINSDTQLSPSTVHGRQNKCIELWALAFFFFFLFISLENIFLPLEATLRNYFKNQQRQPTNKFVASVENPFRLPKREKKFICHSVCCTMSFYTKQRKRQIKARWGMRVKLYRGNFFYRFFLKFSFYSTFTQISSRFHRTRITGKL